MIRDVQGIKKRRAVPGQAVVEGLAGEILHLLADIAADLSSAHTEVCVCALPETESVDQVLSSQKVSNRTTS